MVGKSGDTRISGVYHYGLFLYEMRAPELIHNLVSETLSVRTFPSQGVFVERTYVSRILAISNLRGLRTSYLKQRSERLDRKPR